MAFKFEFSKFAEAAQIDLCAAEVLSLIQGAVGVALREWASLVALRAQMRIMPHTRTGETVHGIEAGMQGRKVLVQTAWPGIAIDRPHRLLGAHQTKSSQRKVQTRHGTMYRGAGREVPGLYYMEEGFADALPSMQRILTDKTDDAARRQEYRLQRFTRATEVQAEAA